MLSIRAQFSVDTNSSIQSGDISNFEVSEKIYADVFDFINDSKECDSQ